MGLLTKLIVVGSVAFTAAAIIFFCAGWFGRPDTQTNSCESLNPTQRERLDLMNKLLDDKLVDYEIEDDLDAVRPLQIRSFLEELSSVPHVAGEGRDAALVNYIAETWRTQGLDSVDTPSYDLLLSYPNSAEKNKIELISDSEVIHTCSVRENLEDLDENFVDAYLAYAPNGTVEGEVVYVHFGMVEDFDLLTADETSEYYTNVTGKICMARYGRIFRGNKVVNAEDYGCAGMIIYSDPKEVAGLGTDEEYVYPNTEFLPGSGIQRGSINPGDGDPETPNYPSLDHVFRRSTEDVNDFLPSIPAQPIGYDDATIIMKEMAGKAPPPEWVGYIDNPDVDYNLGGSFKNTCSNCKVRLEINNERKQTRNSNVIGIIKGDIEPDRYVLFGNHRDAWGYGAADASSGTAQMLEVTRILTNKMKRQGWRPRRSMVFCSWGAEEFGLIGSREFTEDYMVKLMERAVAYVNVDICTTGPIFSPSSSPTIQKKVMDAAKIVESPWNASETLYESWRDWLSIGSSEIVEPSVPVPGAGSDHANFIFWLGIPVVDMTFRPDIKAVPPLAETTYPLYHTGFETFYWMDEIIDPGFNTHATCSRLSLAIGRSLSDSIVQDLRPTEYATLMTQAVKDLQAEVIPQLDSLGVETEWMIEQVTAFSRAATDWQALFDTQSTQDNPILSRMFNDQMMKLDRLFLLSDGLPGRPELRHAIISPSMFNSYGSSVFPGITDLLHGIDLLDSDTKAKRVRELEKHVSDLMILIKSAGDFLKDVSVIV